MTTTALSKDELYNYNVVVRDGAAASLDLRFNGLGTTVSYNGVLQKAPNQRGLGKMTLVAVSPDGDPLVSPFATVDIDLDAVEGLTFETGEAWVTLRWRTAAVEAKFTVSIDPP